MNAADFWSNANSHVWALVCGFPTEKRRKRQLIMLQIYVDESEKDGTFVIAGCLSNAKRWADFSDDWQRVLDCRSPHYKSFKEFHLKDMNLNSPSDIEQCGWYYQVILDHVIGGFSVSFRVSDLKNAVKQLPYKSLINDINRLNNPYHFAFGSFINLMITYQPMINLNEPIDFIFDEKSEKVKCIEAWENMRENSTGERLALLKNMPVFKSSAEVLPLQAADFYVGWVRSFALSTSNLADGLTNQNFPWKSDKILPHIAAWMDEKTIYDNLDRSFKTAFERARTSR